MIDLSNQIIISTNKLAQIFMKLPSIFLQEFDIWNINNIHRLHVTCHHNRTQAYTNKDE